MLALERETPARQRLAAALASTVRPIVMAIWSVLLQLQLVLGMERPVQQRLGAVQVLIARMMAVD